MLCRRDRLDNEVLPDAIIGGLFVVTLARFLFLPALHVAWVRIEEPAKDSSASAHQRVRSSRVPRSKQHGGCCTKSVT